MSTIQTPRAPFAGRTKLMPTAVTVLVAVAGALTLSSTASAAFADTQLSAELSGAGALEAGGHPDLSTAIDIPTDGEFSPPDEDLRDLQVDLPPGLLGDATATARCAQEDVTNKTCSPDAQVGLVQLRLPTFAGQNMWLIPVYSVEPRNDDDTVAVSFYVPIANITAYVDIGVRDDDYGLRATTSGITRTAPITHIDLSLWGSPRAAVHDPDRLDPASLCFEDGRPDCARVTPPGGPERPFLTNPTSCGPVSTSIAVNSYQQQQRFIRGTVPLGTITGCESLPFDPSVSVGLNGPAKAGAPGGLDVAVKVPQGPGPDGRQPSHLRNTEVKLPPGVAINPPGADGLAACSDGDLRTGQRGAAACPDASKVGETEIDVPVLGKTLKGGIFIRPSVPGNMFRIALVASGAGVNVKIPGEIYPDPVTGQITAKFENTPQVPFSELRTRFYGGSRGVLTMPRVCGGHTAQASFTPWSGGATKSGSSAFALTEDCDFGGFAPTVAAGTLSAQGGASSPFSFTMNRGDRDQLLGGVKIELPPGLLARTKDVPLCGDAQATAGTCGAESRVGTATTTAGSGDTPLPLQGPVFLTGPYKGGPYGLAVVVPAKAGPYDLGTVVVRQAIKVDPTTAQLTIDSDPLPTILEGVPLQIRSVRVDVDRPGFMVNPTSCAEKFVQSTVFSTSGASALSRQRYQAADCTRLGQKPAMSLAFTSSGEQKKGKHPGVDALVRPRAGDANMKRVAVTLPEAVSLQASNAKALCKPEQAAAKACPAASIVGTASALTPSLHTPLKGDVYFVEGTRRTASGAVAKTLPKLWVALRGETPLDVWAQTSTTSDGRLTTTFDAVPDAPLNEFRLHINGGKNGILAATTNTCDEAQSGTAAFIGHNNRRDDRTVRIGVACRPGAYMNASATSVRFKYTGIGAGRLVVSGRGLVTTRRTVGGAAVATLTAKLTTATRRQIAAGRTVRLRLTAAYTPKGAKEAIRIVKTVTIQAARRR
jgi:hypothetical protein